LSVLACESTAAIRETGARNHILDAWRAFSVMLVIGGHFSESWLFTEGTVHEAVGHYARLGVYFFFVISGYIITHLLLEEKRTTGRVVLSAFYVRRAFRILPALWVFLLVMGLLSALGVAHLSWPAFLSVATFTCNTGFFWCTAILGHTWSLAVEEQFYLTWPVMVALVPPRYIHLAAWSAVAIFMAMSQTGMLFAQWINNSLCFGSIAAGAAYASSPALQKAIARLDSPGFLLLSACVLIARPWLPIWFPGQFRLNDLLMPFIICHLIFGTFPYGRKPGEFAVTRALAPIGLVSYSLYLWQQPFAFKTPDMDSSPLLLLLLAPAAIGSYLYVERPAIRMARVISDRLRGRACAERPEGAVTAPAS
jgi:peptidoglycan/LPS O-acetylase OafA/YrhL